MRPIVGGELMLLGHDVTAIVIVGGLAIGVIGMLIALYAVGTDESAKETYRRKRRARLLRRLGAGSLILLLGAGYGYGAEYMIDGQCTSQNWDMLVGSHGYVESLIIWYVIAGC